MTIAINRGTSTMVFITQSAVVTTAFHLVVLGEVARSPTLIATMLALGTQTLNVAALRTYGVRIMGDRVSIKLMSLQQLPRLQRLLLPRLP